MSRIVIFGGTNVDPDEVNDPSIKIYLVCDSADKDERVISIPNKNILDFYIDEKLEEVAKALGVSAEAIKNFTEENMINYFNNFYDNSCNGSNGMFHANYCTFNPLDKVVELYERMIQSEKDKVEYLEKLLKEK